MTTDLIAHPDDFFTNRQHRLLQANPSLKSRPVNINPLTGIIKNDFLLNDDTSGGTNQQNPALATNQQGSIVIGWTDYRDGNADIYVQRLDTNNNYLGNNFRVNNDATMMWQGEPAIAVDTQGNFVVVWEDRRTWNSDVYLQRFSHNGQALGDNIVVNDNLGSSDQRHAAVIMLPNQHFIVVWDDWRNDWGDIYLQRFNNNGERVGNNIRVNDDPIGNNQYHPALSCDANGNYIVTWMDGRLGDWNIYAQRFNQTGQAIGTNFLVNDYHTSFQGYPKIATHVNGSFVIVWQDERFNNADIFTQVFDANGNRIGNNFRVNDDNTTQNQISPNITIDPAGNFLVVWTDQRQGNSDIYAQLFDSNYQPINNNFKINDDLTNQNQGAPAIASIPTRKYWIVWDDCRNNNYDIYLQNLNSNLAFIGSNIKINDDIASSQQRCSWLAQDGAGRLIVVWEDERDGNCHIYGVRLDSLGNILQANFKVNDDSTNAHYYPSVSANHEGDFIVCWSDNRNGNFDIYAQKYSAQGIPIGNNFKVNDDLTTASQWYPVVSCDSTGNAVIVWSDYRHNNYDIYAQRFDTQTNPIGSNFIVNDVLNDEQLYATVNIHKNGNFVICWMDSRNGDFDIYAQRFLANGQPLGTNFKVNNNLDNSFQGYPNLAVSQNGQFAIVWEDERFYNSDIFMQRYQANGLPIDSNLRVNTDIYDEAQYSPSISYDQNGNFVVVWCYLRSINDNYDIYSQAFNTNAQRVGNNIQINQPDVFFDNNQWLIGQSVALHNNRIVYSWIDNRRHQGWDIYSKIVDWNYFTALNENNKELNKISLVKIFPNPTYDKLFIQSTLPIREYQFYNACGQIIDLPMTNQIINIKDLQSGIYFIKYAINKQYYVHKIIVSQRSNNVNN
ncbi:MAG: T9SS type A sorting domain-containing protein [candidate division WOR-3 bacterium]